MFEHSCLYYFTCVLCNSSMAVMKVIKQCTIEFHRSKFMPATVTIIKALWLRRFQYIVLNFLFTSALSSSPLPPPSLPPHLLPPFFFLFLHFFLFLLYLHLLLTYWTCFLISHSFKNVYASTHRIF